MTTNFAKKQGAPEKAKSSKPRPPIRHDALDDAVAAAARIVKGEPAGQWTYHGGDGTPAFTVARFDRPTPKGEKKQKVFRPFHHDGEGWVMADPKGSLPVYRLPHLHQHGVVVLTEGEKAADAAVELGLNATTSAHGADGVGKTDWTALAGREVGILPDEDEAGMGYAERVLAQLHALPTPARIKIIKLPGLSPKGDIVEFIALARERGLGDAAIRAEIEALAAATSECAPRPDAPGAADPEWPEPRPLPSDLPPVKALRKWASERLQTFSEILAGRRDDKARNTIASYVDEIVIDPETKTGRLVINAGAFTSPTADPASFQKQTNPSGDGSVAGIERGKPSSKLRRRRRRDTILSRAAITRSLCSNKVSRVMSRTPFQRGSNTPHRR